MRSSADHRRSISLRRSAYFIVALLILSFAIGSLSKSQPGGSWLAYSYWLLYLIALLPLVALGATVVILVFLVYYFRDMSDRLGSRIAGRMIQKRKKKGRYLGSAIYIGIWGIAVAAYLSKCGWTIPCSSSRLPSMLQKVVLQNQDPSGPNSTLVSGLAGASSSMAILVQSGWFAAAFFGLLIVSAAVFIRSLKVAMDDYRTDTQTDILTLQSEALKAVRDAIQIVQETAIGGPRERILACYVKMINAASKMGANISPDQTARELEKTIKRTFMLNSDGVGILTNLFEEARYSLHPITEEDSQEAHLSLVAIESELNIISMVE